MSANHESQPGRTPGPGSFDPLPDTAGQETPGASWVDEDSSDDLFASDASSTVEAGASWVEQEADAAVDVARDVQPEAAPAPAKLPEKKPARTHAPPGQMKLGALDDLFQRAKKLKDEPKKPR